MLRREIDALLHKLRRKLALWTSFLLHTVDELLTDSCGWGLLSFCQLFVTVRFSLHSVLRLFIIISSVRATYLQCKHWYPGASESRFLFHFLAPRMSIWPSRSVLVNSLWVTTAFTHAPRSVAKRDIFYHDDASPPSEKIPLESTHGFQMTASRNVLMRSRRHRGSTHVSYYEIKQH